MVDSASTPLIGDGGESAAASNTPPSSFARGRQALQHFFTSTTGHYAILILVGLDVAAILFGILITLFTCGRDNTHPIWNTVAYALNLTSMVFSCLFVVELLLSWWAYGHE